MDCALAKLNYITGEGADAAEGRRRTLNATASGGKHSPRRMLETEQTLEETADIANHHCSTVVYTESSVEPSRRHSAIWAKIWRRGDPSCSRGAPPPPEPPITLFRYMIRLQLFDGLESKLRLVRTLRNNHWKRCPDSKKLHIVKQFTKTLAFQLALNGTPPLAMSRRGHIRLSTQLSCEMLLLLTEIVTATKSHLRWIAPAVWSTLTRLLRRDRVDVHVACVALESMQRIAERAPAELVEQLQQRGDFLALLHDLLKSVLHLVDEGYEKRLILAGSGCLAALRRSG